MRIQFDGHNGLPHYWRCVPYKLEYSPKDDKFRLISANKRESLSINLGRIRECFMLEPCEDADYRPKPMKKRTLVLELTDDRNALERVMLHFSHLDKETERIDDTHYRVTLFYEKEDETELLIRVLSFGPVLKAVFPDDFVKKLCERLEKQKNLRTQT
jgi:predicted DNA-binding transcriptional regulator YafY